ncbi:MAG: DUF4139 domain-containing protein [Phycisphaerae bacterium]|nr:DUF4139 domain-containing protein [Phycisphaerae bacterium]
MKRILILSVMMVIGTATAKVDLTTLPTRETVQITIYNSADMTLVRESRPLTLKEGGNNLQFSWENTLIDPTSLEMLPKANADKIQISELSYPPRVKNLGLWEITSGVAGKVPVEITYLTSGLSWRAFYMGTMTPDEKTMRLQGYVLVSNNSGEDYENAQTRLIVGQVHTLDQIADLARREYPYGRPGPVVPMAPAATPAPAPMRARGAAAKAAVLSLESTAEPKQIIKEGLSEYFLYTIEGTETIENGWSKRLPSFEASEVPIINLYKYEEERFGPAVVRFLSFKNDAEHKLGETPIPGGLLKVYRNLDEKQHLAYTGQSEFKYIPVNEDVELNLGTVADVVVEAKLMDTKSDNYRFDRKGNVNGWDDILSYQIEIRNTRDLPIKIEIQRNFPMPYWDLTNQGTFGDFVKIDMDTVKYTLTLEPASKAVFNYVVTFYQGVRSEDWTKKNKG